VVVGDLGGDVNRVHGTDDTLSVVVPRYTPAERELAVTLPAHTGGILVVTAWSVGGGAIALTTYLRIEVAGVQVHEYANAHSTGVASTFIYGQTVYTGAIAAGAQEVRLKAAHFAGAIYALGLTAHVVGAT